MRKRLAPTVPAGGHWAGWLGISGVALLFVALRLNNFNAPLIRDEGEYAYSAQLLLQGVAPYEHAFLQKPPMVVYSYALSGLLLPHVFWAPRLLAAGFTGLATLLLGFIARLEFGKGCALPAMWLVTPMLLLPRIEQFTANTEMFMLVPLLGMVAVHCYSRQHGHQPVHWLAAGLLGVATLLYKYTALPVLAFVYAVWSVELWRATRSTSRLWWCWCSSLAGGALAVIVLLGFFLVCDGGMRLWECTVLFNRYYAHSTNFGLAAFYQRIGEFWGDWWILFILPWAVLLRPVARLWFWLGIFIAALVATGASSYGHYYLVVMPFWALLSAAGLCCLAERVAQRRLLTPPIIKWLLIAVVMILICRFDAPWMALTREQFAAAKLGGWSPFLESQTVAKRIDELSSPSDPVYVAGSEPQILYYAQRSSPTRFITAYALMIPSPVAQKYQQEAIRDLQEHPPALIVLATANSSWLRQATTPQDFLLFLNQLLAQNYQLVGGYVNDGGNGCWTEPLDAKGLATASLVLFQRGNLPASPSAVRP